MESIKSVPKSAKDISIVVVKKLADSSNSADVCIDDWINQHMTVGSDYNTQYIFNGNNYNKEDLLKLATDNYRRIDVHVCYKCEGE